MNRPQPDMSAQKFEDISPSLSISPVFIRPPLSPHLAMARSAGPKTVSLIQLPPPSSALAFFNSPRFLSLLPMHYAMLVYYQEPAFLALPPAEQLRLGNA